MRRALVSLLCAALTLGLAAAVLALYREGMAARALDPLAPIFTPALVAARLRPLLPLALTLAVLSLFPTERVERTARVGRVEHRAFPQAGALRCVLLLAALALLAAGAVNGGARDVLGKAVKICTECIGLG